MAEQGIEESKTEEFRVSPKAAEKVQQLMKEEKKEGWGIKIMVTGGGCSGLKYGTDFAEKPAEGDKIIETNGVKVFIDEMTLAVLEGSTLDYVQNGLSGGFKLDNPNATNTCGCGESFSV